jgi:hypothetical protein
MITRKASRHDRRTVLKQAAVLGGWTLLGSFNRALAESPPQTTTLKLFQVPGMCTAPQEIAKELLELEGFNDVRYMKFGSDTQAGVEGVMKPYDNQSSTFSPRTRSNSFALAVATFAPTAMP